MRKRWLFWGALLCFVAAAAACKNTRLYDGPVLARGQVAVIMDAPWDEGRTGVELLTVDDKDVKGSDKVEVLPGRHTVRARLAAGLLAYLKAREVEITFDTRPGRTYVVRGWVDGGEARAWVEDWSSKTVVAGRKPGAEKA